MKQNVNDSQKIAGDEQTQKRPTLVLTTHFTVLPFSVFQANISYLFCAVFTNSMFSFSKSDSCNN
jgi:hypothetical protein